MNFVFKDELHETLFKEKGYLLVDLPAVSIVNELFELYSAYVESKVEQHNGFFYSLINVAEHNIVLQERIHHILIPFYNSVFSNYDAFCESFLVKKRNDMDEFALHQDWSIVDERHAYSITFWCPLQEVKAENGGIHLIPGSHTFFPIYRSNTLPTARFNSAAFHPDQLKEITVSLGQVLLFNPAIFHGSKPNFTANDRIIVAGNVKSSRDEFVYFHKVDGQTFRFGLNNDAFLTQLPHLANGEMPQIFASKIPIHYHHQEINIDDLKAIL